MVGPVSEFPDHKPVAGGAQQRGLISIQLQLQQNLDFVLVRPGQLPLQTHNTYVISRK
jgi:hypothetical protein